MKKRGKNSSRIGAVLRFVDKEYAGQALTFFGGFVFAWARLGFDISAFAPAFASAVPGRRSIAAILGSCCACLLDLDGVYTARLAAATVFTGMINYCLSNSYFKVNKLIVAPLSCGVCSLLTGLTVLVAQGFNFNGLIIYIIESAVGAGCAAFLSRLRLPKGFEKGRVTADARQLSCAVAFLAMPVISAQRFVIAGISLADIAAMVIILSASALFGLTGGCISAGIMGFSVCLLPEASLMGVMYTLAGIVCGVTSRFGRTVQGAAFVSAGFILLLMNAGQFRLLPAVCELIISVVIFAAIPKRFFGMNRKSFASDGTLPEFESMKKSMLTQLESVSTGLDEVAQAVDKIADEMRKTENISNENGIDAQTRQLVRDQFSTLSTAVREIAFRFSDEVSFDMQLSSRIGTVLADHGIKTEEVVCSSTGKKEKIEIRAERINKKISRAALVDDIEAVCGYKLTAPAVEQDENSTRMVFEKRPAYKLHIGNAQRIAQGRLCGDSCDDFSDKDGNRIVVISDGMGTGPKAAVDGTVAAWLFSKLLASGLGFESSLRLVNSAMIVKSSEESLATIDAVRINLNSGKTDFFKAGAGITLVCKGKKVYNIGNPSMPLGILREVEFDTGTLELKRGDKLLMMSDGIPQTSYAEIAQKLSRFNKNDPSELAGEVVRIAEKYSELKHPDDMTAVAVIVG